MRIDKCYKNKWVIKSLSNLLLQTSIILSLLLICSTSVASGHKPVSPNPVIMQQAADPHVIAYNGKYYMYPTYLADTLFSLSGSDRYEVWVSEDMQNWEKHPQPIFNSEDLSTTDGIKELWAPDVFYDERDKMFYLYYTTYTPGTKQMAIGVAESSTPTGRFVDRGVLLTEAIDAHMFKDDDGEYYLYYSTFLGNTDLLENLFSAIFSLLPVIDTKPKDTLAVVKMRSPTELFDSEIAGVELTYPDTAWEKGLIMDINEGAWVIKEKGIYYLMYSGGETMLNSYSLGYATSLSPLGPFVKYKGNPIVGSNDFNLEYGRATYGPGHHSVVKDYQGEYWVFYHSKKSPVEIGMQNRYISKDRLTFSPEGVLGFTPTPLRKF